jgi:formaldehyde-activating enzyme involved in methanogenesis
MKWLITPLLGVIFVALIACSIQSVSADHESDEGIFKDENEVNLADTKNTNYQVYLQAVHRNGDGQLISVVESTANAGHISHKLTDDIFDTLMGKKEIIIIDNIKYEKVQYTFSPTLEQRWMGMYPILEQITININVEGDALVQMNKKIKDHNVWKIHYCADFANIGHDGLQCIPIFQVLVPTMMLEPTDVITQQWTILRELN